MDRTSSQVQELSSPVLSRHESAKTAVAPPIAGGQQLLVIAILVVALSALFWWRYTVDDTYIALRYAHNLAAGNGPVFNVGEHVEGFSSPLWVAFLAGAERLGGNPLVTAKITGVLCAVLLLLILYASLRKALGDSFVAGAAAIWLAVTPGIHAYASSGMETVPFALAIAAAIITPTLFTSARRRASAMTLCLLAVATLRPEGLLLFVLLAVHWQMTDRTVPARVGLIISIFLLFCLILLRTQYYDALLPNTYLAKPSPLWHRLSSDPFPSVILYFGHKFVLALLSMVNPIGGIGLLFCLLPFLFGRKPSPLVTASLLSAAAGLMFVFFAPVDWMPADRFALPFAFPLVVVAATGLHGIITRLHAAEHPLRLSFAALLAVWSLMQIHTIVIMHQGWRETNTALDGDLYMEMGKWLGEQSAQHERLLAFEVGAVGYFSGRSVIDHEGLVTRPVAAIVHRAGGYDQVRRAKQPHEMEEIVRYCVAQRPDWFLVRSISRLDLHAGDPVPDDIADEEIQRALLREMGGSMTLANVFTLRLLPDGRADRYLMLHRTNRF